MYLLVNLLIKLSMLRCA